jgi:hypothetical protein
MRFKEYGESPGSGASQPDARVTGQAAYIRRRARRVAEGIKPLRRDSDDELSAFNADEAESRARKVLGLTAPDMNDGDRPSAVADRWREARKETQALDRELAAAQSSPRLAEPLARVRANNQALSRALRMRLARLDSRRAPRPGVEVRSPGAGAGAADRPGPQAFQVEPADGRRATWVTPGLKPATLEVASPAHGQVRVPALARFFPAHTVHARRSTAVVAASHCELKSTDHYHVHRVTVGFDEFLGQGRDAMRDLFRDRSDAGIARFQRAMKCIADGGEHGDTRASVPLREDPHTLIASSKNVQLGDGSRMTVNTHYVVEESTLPLSGLLAHDKDLVRSFLAAVDGPERGPETRKFLSDALSRAGRADDLSVLGHGSGLRTPDTSIRWIFGVDSVAWASAVMVGSDNDLLTRMRVERGSLSPGRIRGDLERVRRSAAKVPGPADRAPERPGRIGPGRVPPGAAPPSPFGFSIREPREPGRNGRPGRGGLW